MKKFIVNLLVFFVIIAVVDLSVGCVGDYMQAHAKGGSTKEFNDLVRNDCHDLLILGSSRAHHHYDTPFLSDTLGLDVYNAGYDGNGVILAYGILELALKQSKPKLLIFDVEPAFDIIVYDKDNQHRRYISDLKPYYKTQEISDIIWDISKEEWYKVHSGMIRYNTDIIKMSIDNIIERQTPPKGFDPLGGKIENSPPNTPKRQNPVKAYEIDEVKIKYVEKLVELSKRENITIVLVASPKYGSIESSVYSPIISICKKHGVPFWNYYTDDEFLSHPEWFKEPMHLNATGARVFSAKIVEDVKPYISRKEH